MSKALLDSVKISENNCLNTINVMTVMFTVRIVVADCPAVIFLENAAINIRQIVMGDAPVLVDPNFITN